MRCLLHILPIILGDTLNGNEYFECLLLLHDRGAGLYAIYTAEGRRPEVVQEA